VSGRYVLDGHKAVPEPNLLKWAAWFEKADNRRVAYTEVSPGVTVSTVFLGLDHGFGGYDGVLLFETMVFGGEHDGEMDRASTWEEAEEQHAVMLALVKS
jgi:hypothetical protein